MRDVHLIKRCEVTTRVFDPPDPDVATIRPLQAIFLEIESTIEQWPDDWVPQDLRESTVLVIHQDHAKRFLELIDNAVADLRESPF